MLEWTEKSGSVGEMDRCGRTDADDTSIHRPGNRALGPVTGVTLDADHYQIPGHHPNQGRYGWKALADPLYPLGPRSWVMLHGFSADESADRQSIDFRFVCYEITRD